MLQLRLVQPIGQVERGWIDAVLAQNGDRILRKVGAQRRVLPEPRNESRHGQCLRSRHDRSADLLRTGGDGGTLQGREKPHDKFKQHTDRC